MYDATSPLDVPTPHHLLDGFLAARAETMPEEILVRDRAVIESFRAFLERRDESRGLVDPPDELAGLRVERHNATPRDVLAARRITLEIGKFHPGVIKVGPNHEATSGRLVLLMLGRWMLDRQLINGSESRMIDEATYPYVPPPPTRRAYRSRASRGLW